MVHHCKAVTRGAQKTFVVGDMPFGSYEASSETAILSAFRYNFDTFIRLTIGTNTTVD